MTLDQEKTNYDFENQLWLLNLWQKSNLHKTHLDQYLTDSFVACNCKNGSHVCTFKKRNTFSSSKRNAFLSLQNLRLLQCYTMRFTRETEKLSTFYLLKLTKKAQIMALSFCHVLSFRVSTFTMPILHT